MYNLVLSKDARKFIDRQTPHARQRIRNALLQLAEDPFSSRQVKRLKGTDSMLRLIYTLHLFIPRYILDTYHGGVHMQRAKIFQSGRSQAVRLPKEFRFNGTEVYVKRVGNAVVLLPTEDAWDSLAQALDLFSDDYMSDREQPIAQEREEPF